MKVCYIDCIGGISGDMIIAAFVDAGVVDKSVLEKELRKLNIDGFTVSCENVNRQHVSAVKIDFIAKGSEKNYSENEIKSIIAKSKIDRDVKEDALKLFDNLVKAEKSVHKGNKHLHLHEIGSLDTILDVAGIAICLKKSEAEKILYSNIPLGRGVIKTKSGVLPVPAPATLELLRGLKVKFSKDENELVTPTGAAFIKTFGQFREEPLINVEKIGYGAGTRDSKDIPNVLRIVMGEEEPSFAKDEVTIIQTAIDDTPPLVYSYLYDELFKAGALDVYVTNISMKKNRPGHLLTVILPGQLLNTVCDLIFKETGTIGVRYYKANRMKLERENRMVRTKYGNVSVKMSGLDNSVYKASPEYESCKKIAQAKKMPFKKVYEEAKKAALGALSVLCLCLCGNSYCDTINLKNGTEVKGIVVEEYEPKVVISTEAGEITIPKSDINAIQYDLPEQNLVALGNKYKEAGDYQRAYFYYEKANKVNPDYEEASDGLNFISGFLFRKEMAKKSDEVEQRQEVEDFFSNRAKKEKELLDKLSDSVGITIEERGKNIVVSGVNGRSAAYTAGIRQNDIIAAIWGKLTGYLSREEIAEELTKTGAMEIKIQVDREVAVEENTLLSSQLALKFEGLVLANIFEASRAYVKGLRDGDLILEVNGESIRYTPKDQVIKLMREKPPTLKIRRELTIWRKT